ncbi:MAG TPA: hypothetical protein HPQ04_05840, partial [Rhodospirillaceae bacterium]|nr:hypothetical protein [Rhodospirillaceae bacterium]
MAFKVPVCIRRVSVNLTRKIGVNTMKLFAAIFLLLLVLSGSSGATGVVEEEIGLPVSFSEAGQVERITLEAMIIRPDDDRRHPLAVLNHGAPRNADDRAGMSPR